MPRKPRAFVGSNRGIKRRLTGHLRTIRELCDKNDSDLPLSPTDVHRLVMAFQSLDSDLSFYTDLRPDDWDHSAPQEPLKFIDMIDPRVKATTLTD